MSSRHNQTKMQIYNQKNMPNKHETLINKKSRNKNNKKNAILYAKIQSKTKGYLPNPYNISYNTT